MNVKVTMLGSYLTEFMDKGWTKNSNLQNSHYFWCLV